MAGAAQLDCGALANGMSLVISWLIGAAILAVVYAGGILFLRKTIRSWAYLLAPALFVALLGYVIYTDLSAHPGELATGDIVFLALVALLWAVGPALVLYRLNQRPSKTSVIRQLGYGVGAFYVATAAAFLLTIGVVLLFHLPFRPRG